MPHYFMNLFNGEADVIDQEGRELADLESARRAALKAAGEIVADEMASGRVDIRLTMIIENEARERLLELPVAVTVG